MLQGNYVDGSTVWLHHKALQLLNGFARVKSFTMLWLGYVPTGDLIHTKYHISFLNEFLVA